MIKKFKEKMPVLKNCWLAFNALIIGDVACEKDVSVWYNAVIRADEANIKIGSRTNIQDGVVIHCDQNFPVLIESGCTIGHNATIHGCTIQENTVIGMGATILNGANIGKNCIIGANALVTENTIIPDNSLVVGVPAKIIRMVKEKEISYNKENANVYIELAKEQLEETKS